MRNDYIQYLNDLHITDVDDLLQRFLLKEIDRQEFDMRIGEWAFSEQNFVKDKKIENLINNK